MGSCGTISTDGEVHYDVIKDQTFTFTINKLTCLGKATFSRHPEIYYMKNLPAHVVRFRCYVCKPVNF